MFKQLVRSSKVSSFRGLKPLNARTLTTKNTIVEHTTGRIITLTDPNRPEMGDYPNPPPVLAQDKDPYAKYDDQQNRRNMNDPLNFDDDLYDMWSPDYFQPVSDATALKHNGIFFACFLGFGGIIAYFQLNPEKPAMPRSYPSNGLAQLLGSGKPEDDEFYQVRPDTTAEKELGILPADKDLFANIEAYKSANAEFINQ